MKIEFDRDRATALQLIIANAQSDGVSAPLFVDSPAAQQYEHWIVDEASASVFDPAGSNVQPLSGPLTGLFLCPPQLANVPPVLDQPSSLQGIQLPMDADAGLGTSGFNNGVQVACTKRFVVPPLWFVRAIFNDAGPYPATTGIQLLMTLVKEKQCGQAG